MFELIFLKILLQTSILLLQTVPKRYTSILYTVKNLVKMIFKPPSPKKTHFFIYIPNPRSAKFAMETFMKFDWHYSVKQWLTLVSCLLLENEVQQDHIMSRLTKSPTFYIIFLHCSPQRLLFFKCNAYRKVH